MFVVRIALLWIVTVILFACQPGSNGEEQPAAQTNGLVVRSGTSFGMCMGYCLTELEITPTQITFRKKALREAGKYPERECKQPITAEEWKTIQPLIDFDTFKSLPAVTGCPDCADGGAEWVEINNGDQNHKITFEFNGDMAAIQPLLAKIREIREQQTAACQ